ncbi:sulfatase family protein [Pontiella sulfatireligans]|uniref:Arylsulfatase n=1 Tax=Pontiella sulfatireligans TaxID=2750658 RepID=A0A6C2UJZ4_9BACT|nr:arylsulfatase [Pontiella sulfatireligans]SPS74367.1 sulfatase S1_15 [Kiritimatiellales bacterium]VGO19634.1 Arylsulfatase [Pontiella sulfatireligans]
MKTTVLMMGVVLAVAAFGAKPNIVYILADDMGPGDVVAYNKDCKFPTPNIDRLANEGMKFMDAHSNSSVCTPTRYGILTGRYAWRTFLKSGVEHGHDMHMIDPERETVASLLKKQGYRTACVGKWHLGMDWTSTDGKDIAQTAPTNVDFSAPMKNCPLDVGFDYYFGIAASLNMDPHAYIDGRQTQGTLEFLKDKAAVKARGLEGAKAGWAAKEFVQSQVLPDFAKKTCDWIRENARSASSGQADQPFFVYMPLNSPHTPIVPSSAFDGKSGLSPYGDFCMETDWAVGEVLKTLDELGIADNTIVVFTADNGTSPGSKFENNQAKGHYSSWIYRGLKGTTWEGGHRVPFVVRWPEGVKAGTVSEQLICTTDLMATVAELSGIKLAENIGEDSVSFLPALKGAAIPNIGNRGVVHHSDGGTFAIRCGKWKLLFDNEGGSRRQNPKDKPVINSADFLLFDMEKDAVESTNLSAEYPEVVTELKMLLADYVNKGRSTPGAPQENDPMEGKKKWTQIDAVK